MKSTKSKRSGQAYLRQFKIVVGTNGELVYSDGKAHLFAFDAIVTGEEEWAEYQVFVEPRLFFKRSELFRAGHRLVIRAYTDGVSPILYAVDAWFDRERPYRDRWK